MQGHLVLCLIALVQEVQPLVLMQVVESYLGRHAEFLRKLYNAHIYISYLVHGQHQNDHKAIARKK